MNLPAILRPFSRVSKVIAVALAIAACVLVTSPMKASALTQVVSVPASSDDTEIRSANRMVNQGSATTITADGDEPAGTGKSTAALIRFSLPTLPAGATITDTKLRLNVTKSSTDTYSVFVMKKAWVEGEATWNMYERASVWDLAGGRGATDRESAAIASITPSATGVQYFDLGAAFDQQVDDWMSGEEANNGIQLINTDGTDGFDFSTREVATGSQRPQLIVTYVEGIVADTTPPETTIDSGPSGTVSTADASFSFSANEPSTFECSLDGDVFASCSSPQSYANLSEGSHTFAVRATDAAANTNVIPASRTFSVDTIAPDTTIDSGPSGTITVADATFAFSSSEAGATFECSLDGAAYSACTSPKSYTNLSNGSHAFEVRATDAAGNTGVTPVSTTFSVEVAPPPPPPPSGCADGLFDAEYRNEVKGFSTQSVLTRCETGINNDWGSSSPGSGVNADSFTARWVGTFDFEPSDYEFTATSDDGIRLWIDEQLLIDQWKDQAAATYKATQTMTAGEHEVKVEYYENTGLAVAEVTWAKVASSPPDQGTTLYASPSGSGTTCSEANPCSLHGARDKVRTMNASMSTDITVLLRGGSYRLEAPLTLNPQDSGTGGFEVVYKAYPGEVPVLSGGQPIGTFSLFDSTKNIYRASVSPTFDTREVWVNGARAQRARSVKNPGGFTKTSTGYTTTDAQMALWRNPSDIEIVGEYEWNQHRCSVESISVSMITMDNPCWRNSTDHGYEPSNLGLPTYVENAYELLDAPGEWYLDKSADYLYYIPRGAEALDNVVAGSTTTLLSIVGSSTTEVRNVRFEGLTFQHSGWTMPSTPVGFSGFQGGVYDDVSDGVENGKMMPAAVHVSYARGLEFRGNVFEQLGTSAIHLQDGVKDSVVVGNRLLDIGGGGIYLGNHTLPNPTAAQLNQNNVLDNNYINRTGAGYAGTHGIWLGYPNTTSIKHNEILNSSYSPIAAGWGWSFNASSHRATHIAHNLISNYLTVLNDGGGIYTLGAQPDTVIERNYIQNGINRFAALYPDQGSAYIAWRYNVIDRVPTWLHIHSGSGCNNMITNNYSNTSAATINNSCNTIHSNVFATDSAWPAEAQSIMNAAGLEEAYRDIRR